MAVTRMGLLRTPYMMASFRRNLITSNSTQMAIKNVVVIGGGLMGSGIAQVIISDHPILLLCQISMLE